MNARLASWLLLVCAIVPFGARAATPTQGGAPALLAQAKAGARTPRIVGELTITGQVFIVTKARENVRMGLVTVGLLPLDAVLQRVAAKRAEADSELDTLRAEFDRWSEALRWKDAASRLAAPDDPTYLKLRWRADHLSTAEFYFEDLPAPLGTAQTDADGRFVLRVPRTGNFVLAARAQRRLIDTTEEYYWLMRLPDDARRGTQILMSNDTLTTGNSPLSLIVTSE